MCCSKMFDSRSPRFKVPFGALRCGQTVTLTCRPPASEGFTHCAVLLYQEFANLHQEIELPFSKIKDGRACFTASFPVPPEPDLVWYHFRLWRDDGSGCLLDKTGCRSHGTPESWQLTVYQESHTPEWFGQGVTYQIFPDRYCRLHLPDPAGMVGDRWIHEHWEEDPAWWADPDGEIRNRDFFGGTLAGITAHLEDLAALSVTTLYFCPIFESASNHRYNTADYTKIDPMLGTEEDFRTLCAKAKDLGIRVILDGVFNHTGSQSIYFNADGYYPSLGAAQSKDSPYYDWFSFTNWPHEYESWWGIRTLPNVQESCPDYVDYIIENENSILRRWLRAGASGWRLDVADELPDSFIEKLRTAIEETDPDALLLGEVWEDASNKISYSQRRKYLLGRELHCVMNYPFRTSLLAYLQGGSASDFREAMETIRENYPPAAFYSALNFLGTHDTPRILTMLGGEPIPEGRERQSTFRLSPAARQRGLALVRLAAAILFTFPGSPMIYYGDEAGMEGCADPFNRGTYPWGKEDRGLLRWFTMLGAIRHQRPSLQKGGIHYLTAEGPLLAFYRECGQEITITAVNAGPEPRTLDLPNVVGMVDLLRSQSQDSNLLSLPPFSVRVLGN